MIPKLIDVGAPWKVLPKGIHDADINEFKRVFVNNQHRKMLFRGLKKMVNALKNAGCKTVYIDGSYVTSKENPNDYDICWDTKGVDINKLDPVLITFANKREAQKNKYLGECFPSHFDAGNGQTFIDFFQIDRYTGESKGILRLHI